MISGTAANGGSSRERASGPDRIRGLYCILDAETLAARDVQLEGAAVGLRSAGVRLVQYRDKWGSPQDLLAAAAILRRVFENSGARLIMNDRADLAMLAGFDGVHVGQQDLAPDDVLAGSSGRGRGLFAGISTHTEQQVVEADLGTAAYVAFGPIFKTSSKADAEPAVGVEGLRRARALTTKPLVAIGGITRENAPAVLEAGADAIAVISALFVPGEPIEKVARDFLHLFR